MRCLSALAAIAAPFAFQMDAGLPTGSHQAGANLELVNSLAQAESSATGPDSPKAQITAYPNFKDVCSAFVVGLRSVGPKLFPQRGHFAGSCQNNATPILFSVTHENDKNNHNGSANYDPNIVSYMGDLNVDTDLGRWINASFTPSADGAVLTMSLDTVNYHQTNVTGWPLQFGHLFFGANDLSINATLDKPIAIDFDFRVTKEIVRSELYPGGYSGHRIMVGLQMAWDEASPRTNRTHYLEVDLIQTEGYTASYGDPNLPLCKDAIYDRCFYSDNGRYAEGREISYRTFLKNPPVPVNTDRWVHVHIPLSDIVEKLRWVSPPMSWGTAKLGGLYIGIESEGATQAAMEIRNYQVSRTN
jgi:hypothetical protein